MSDIDLEATPGPHDELGMLRDQFVPRVAIDHVRSSIVRTAHQRCELRQSESEPWTTTPDDLLEGVFGGGVVGNEYQTVWSLVEKEGSPPMIWVVVGKMAVQKAIIGYTQCVTDGAEKIHDLEAVHPDDVSKPIGRTSLLRQILKNPGDILMWHKEVSLRRGVKSTPAGVWPGVTAVTEGGEPVL